MAGKVNTKFVIILAVICAMLAGGAASFYWFVVRKDASELEAQGDRNIMLARDIEVDPKAEPEIRADAQERRGKNYRLAAQSYGRAWNRDPRNVEVLEKYIEAYSNMPVKDQYEANDVRKQIYALTRQTTELRPDDQERLEKFYQLIHRWAREFGKPGYYRDIYALATTRLESDPDSIPALKFRGISQAVQLSDDMDRSKQEEMRSDLETVLETRPNDTDALHYLARLEVYEAGRLERADMNASGIETARQRAIELSEKALAADPDSLQVQIEYLDVLSAIIDGYKRSSLMLGRSEEESEALLARREEVLAIARPALDRLEDTLLQNPDEPYAVQRVAEMLPRFDAQRIAGDTTAGLDRTERLLTAATEARPDMLLYKLMLANVRKLQLQLDPAHEAFLAARDHDIRGNYEISLRDEVLRQQAIFEVANIELIRAEAATDPEERKELLVAADKAVDNLQAVVDEDKRVLMLRGKIALLRGEYTKAMVNIDQASDLSAGKDIEALLLSARARQAEKQWGAATERLERVLTLVGDNPRQDIQTNIRLQLAEMLIRSRRFEPAKQQIDLVLLQLPGNPTAVRLLAQWHLQQEQYDEAIQTLASGDFGDDPAVASQMADIYIAAEQPEKAQALLAEKLDQTPGDIRLLQKYLRLAEDDAAKSAAIDRAASAGAEPRAIDLLRMQLAGSQEGAEAPTLDEMVERATDTNADEFDQLIRKAQIYFQFREFDKAREAFEAAKAINPDDDRVIILALDLAIIDKDFETARRVVGDAARRNLDLADGNFLRGRLAAAEGDKDRQALVFYEQGLKLRPIFADGWRQYGDLQVREKDYDKAIEAYNTAVSQKPDDARSLSGLANAHSQLGQHVQALEALRSAVNYSPDNEKLVARYLAYEERYGNSDIVLAMRRELAETQPQNYTNRAALAMIAAEAGDTAEAFKLLDDLEQDTGKTRELAAARAAVSRVAGDPQAGKQVILDYIADQGSDVSSLDYILLARYGLSARLVNDSLEAYKQAVQLESSDNRLASREYADVLFNFGQVQEAAEVYQDLYSQPDVQNRGTLGNRLAESLLRSGNPDQAEVVLNDLPDTATTDALNAMLANQRGDKTKALDYINRSLEKDPQNAMTLLQRASLYATDAATQSRALSDVEEALRYNPNSVPALNLKSQLQMALGQTTNAARTLRTILDKAPGNNEARLQLARLYSNIGDLDSAESLIDEGLELEPDNLGWVQLGANIAAARGDNDSAIASYEKLMQTNPSPQLLAQLATLYLNNDKPAAADRLLGEQAAMLNASPVLQSLRGRALAQMGKNDQAVRIFTLALQRSQSQNQVNDVTRQILAPYGYEQTVKLLENVPQMGNPSWAGFAIVGLAMSQRDFEGALERLDGVRQTASPSDTALQVQIEKIEALCKLQTEDYLGARDAYQRLLKADPNNIEVLNNLAYILANNLNDPDGAVPMAQKAAELAPNNPEILDTLGWTQYQTGDARNARITLEESVRIRALPANTLHLGRVYMDLDEADRARNVLTQTIQLAENAGLTETVEEARDYLQRLDR